MDGITFACRLAEFDVRHLYPVSQAHVVRRQTGQRQPLLRRGAVRRQVLVGRLAVRNNEKLVQFQRLKDRPGRCDMAQVRRVEGAAVDSDFQKGKSPFVRDINIEIGVLEFVPGEAVPVPPARRA